MIAHLRSLSVVDILRNYRLNEQPSRLDEEDQSAGLRLMNALGVVEGSDLAFNWRIRITP